MALSDRRLKRWYNAINKKWFDGQLPANTEVWYEHVQDACAMVEYDGCDVTFDESTDTWLIRINPALAWSSRLARFALIHEMVHIAVGIGGKRKAHGAKFQYRMMLLAASGAFKDLW